MGGFHTVFVVTLRLRYGLERERTEVELAPPEHVRNEGVRLERLVLLLEGLQQGLEVTLVQGVFGYVPEQCPPSQLPLGQVRHDLLGQLVRLLSAHLAQLPVQTLHALSEYDAVTPGNKVVKY